MYYLFVSIKCNFRLCFHRNVKDARYQNSLLFIFICIASKPFCPLLQRNVMSFVRCEH